MAAALLLEVAMQLRSRWQGNMRDSAMRFSAATFVVGALLIGALRHAGHPALIDRGEGQPRDWADHHSAYHAGGAAAVALTVALVDGAVAGGLVSFSLWAAVELAQRFPREGVGYFEWPDMLWNAIGAAAGAVLAAAIRAGRRAAILRASRRSRGAGAGP